MRENAKIMAAWGKPEVAFSLMCQDKSVRRAVEDSGQLCPTSDVEKVSQQSLEKEAAIAEACKYPTPTCKQLKKW